MKCVNGVDDVHKINKLDLFERKLRNEFYKFYYWYGSVHIFDERFLSANLLCALKSILMYRKKYTNPFVIYISKYWRLSFRFILAQCPTPNTTTLTPNIPNKMNVILFQVQNMKKTMENSLLLEINKWINR